MNQQTDAHINETDIPTYSALGRYYGRWASGRRRTAKLQREKTVVRSVTEYDTAIVFLHDTIRDTIVIQIPIEQKEYRDTVSADSMRVRLHILFHGYHAGIDHVGLSYDARPIIRTEVRKKGWGQFVGIGIGAGYGACVQSGIVYAGPQVGLNVVYGFGYHF